MRDKPTGNIDAAIKVGDGPLLSGLEDKQSSKLERQVSQAVHIIERNLTEKFDEMHSTSSVFTEIKNDLGGSLKALEDMPVGGLPEQSMAL